MTIELNPITSGYSTGLINDNFQAIEDYVNQKLLNKDGLTTGEANQMEVDLDMNSHDILNLATLQVQDITVDGSNATGVLQRAVEAAEDSEAQASYSQEWAQSDTPISVGAGGDGVTDRSSKFWAEEAEAAATTFDISAVLPSSQRFAVGSGIQSVDLGNTELHPEAVRVYIDGVYQFTTTWDLTLGVLTPVGATWPGNGVTTNMEVLVDATMAGSFNIPSNGSVSTDKILDRAVTSDKLEASVLGAFDDKISDLEEFVTSSKQVPSGLLNARYLQLPEYKVRLIAQEKNIYNAFPGGVTQLGESIVAIYSSGEGHANSDRQRWVRSDNSFQTFTTGTFLENSTGAYDNSFLQGILGVSESTNFKSVFTVKNVGGTLTNFTTSIVTVTDPYALWGAPKFIDGQWYTTGYRTSGGAQRPALFTSADGMETWSFVSIITSSGSLQLNETSIEEAANGEWLAITREDSSPDRDLYITKSTDSGASWGTRALMPSHVKGTQPFLLRLSNDDLLLFAGDRSGTSGLDDAGNHNSADNITGIACWKSTDNGSTWGDTIMLAPSWSTDCGQPLALQKSDGTVGMMSYLAPAATNGTLGIEPGIYWIEFNPATL